MYSTKHTWKNIQLYKCSIVQATHSESGTLEGGLVQYKIHEGNIEEWVTLYDWDEGEVSGDAEQLIHSAIDDPEWSFFLVGRASYSWRQSRHSTKEVLTISTS